MESMGESAAGIDLGALPPTIALGREADGSLAFDYIDQRALPRELVMERTGDWRAVVDAIKALAVRGAPALGVSGAAALALWAANVGAQLPADEFAKRADDVAERIAAARPTAVNLRWGTERAARRLHEALADGSPEDAAGALECLVAEMEAEDEAANRAIGAHGAELVPDGARLLTHCNAGSLATVFFGTALGVVYAAAEQGKVERVYADETRPVGQGARLTTWELARVGVPVTLICDNMAASLMGAGKVDAVFVGADRITANGDVANKIGTYGVAILARHHGIPFYVAAPTSTVDLSIETGAGIPIEQRDPSEVAAFVTDGVEIWNPAFDVTPADLVTGIVTEAGVFAPADIACAVERAKAGEANAQ